MLDALGLSTRDETVYRAMLERPDLDVGGLAAHVEMTQEEVRAAFDTLIDLALIQVTDGSRARARRPNSGLRTLLAKAEAEMALRQQRIEATRAAVAAMTSVYDDSDAEPVRRLNGIETVRDRLAELAHTAAIDCLSFSPGGAQRPDTIATERPLNVLALQRGVTIRNLYLESFRSDPGTLAHARWLADYGSQSRTVPTLPMRMVIVDRAIALVPIDPHDADSGALELHSPGVVAGLVALFEQLWVTGTPLGDAPPRDVKGHTAQERELLSLLARGHTDTSAGRQLGISTRSVQRLMTTLTERLNAASRFQAGVEASRQGWV